MLQRFSLRSLIVGASKYERYKLELDVTELVNWSVSNSRVLKIQNFPVNKKSVEKINKTFKDDQNQDIKIVDLPTDLIYAPGAITWLASGSATVTATTYNPFKPGSPAITAKLDLKQDTVAEPTLLQVKLFPHHPENITSSTNPVNLMLIGFYSDGSTRTLVNGVTGSSTAPQATVVAQNDQLQLDLSSKPTTASFDVTVNYGGKSDTVKFFQNIP